MNQDIAAPVPSKPKRISRKVMDALDAMATGKCRTLTDAAAHVGLSREHLSRQLAKPHVTAHVEQKARRQLAIAAGRASAVKVDLLDSPSDHVRDNASSFVLGLAGIKPAVAPTVSVNLELRAGYVIDLREDHEILELKAIPQ